MQDVAQKRGWWGRNWKWFVPVGCLIPLVLAIAVCAGIVGLVFQSMKSSWAYSEGVKLAVHNKEVVAALGEPVTPGWTVSGSVNVSGSSGHADLTIPLSGPRGKGTLYVVARKEAGQWKFTRAEVEVEGRKERIDLLLIDILGGDRGALPAAK